MTISDRLTGTQADRAGLAEGGVNQGSLRYCLHRVSCNEPYAFIQSHTSPNVGCELGTWLVCGNSHGGRRLGSYYNHFQSEDSLHLLLRLYGNLFSVFVVCAE